MTYKKLLSEIANGMNELYDSGRMRKEWIEDSNPNNYKQEYKHIALRFQKKRIIPFARYRQMFENLGLIINTPTHANGIGNNCAYTITKRISLSKGYESDAIIGEFNYNYDLFGSHVFVSFYDKDNNVIYRDIENIYYE